MSSDDSDAPASLQVPWLDQFRWQRIDSPSTAQQEASRWDGELTVAIGGPGTGKSTTIGLLVDRLTSQGGVSADECTVLSFNRSVTTEMRTVLREELGSRGHEIEVQTAHAKAREVLAEAPAAASSSPPDAEIATEVDQQLALQAALQQTQESTSISETTISRTLNSITGVKKSGLTPDELDAALGDDEVYERIEAILDEIAAAASQLLTPTAATPATLEQIRARLRVIGDRIESVIPPEVAVEPEARPSAQPALTATAWAYLDLLRQTTAAAESWVAAKETVICQDHPELAALPAYLLGASDPDSAFPGSVDSWPLSQYPHREATLFVEEAKRAAEILPTWSAYEAELVDRGLIDFETLLAEAVSVLEAEPATRKRVQVERMIIDEGQDLSPLMLAFARHLSATECIIFGDTCQTINEWAGANRRSIADLIDEGANVLRLDVDYRKAPAIERFCDSFRETIEDEASLDLRSHRAKTVPTGTDPPWPASPIRWVPQGDNWTAAYQAVLEAVQNDAVPGWTVPDDATIATLGRRNKTISAVTDAVAPDTVTKETSPSIPALFRLARFLSRIAGFGYDTEYIGQYADTDDGTAEDDDPIELLPELLATWYDIPQEISAVLERDDCPPWIALVRLVEYGQDEPLEQPAYRSAFADAYRDLIALGNRTRRSSLGQLFQTLIDQFGLRSRAEIRPPALEALNTAMADIDTPDGAPPPRPDQGAIAQLKTRWQTAYNESEAGSHTVSTVHRFKGDEADIVILPNLTAGPWGVLDTSSRPVDRQRAVDALARVRHRVAFDTTLVTESMVQRKRHNERRVAYTAISRARDLLILLGAPTGQQRLQSAAIDPDGCLPADVRRVDAAHAFDIWTELKAALPADGATPWSRESLGLEQSEGDTDA
jgi:DNA helicase-2/ATP-dependent DNA helicase PcrA